MSFKSKYFKAEEFDSPDVAGSGNFMDPRFIEVLDSIREHAGIPFIISSGYRTPAHNIAVGGGPNSAHLRGMAVDIKANTGRQKFIIIRAAVMNGIQRIGIGKSFVHIDMDLTLPYPTIWLY